MANLRVFVSSTAFDLGVLRSSLRTFIDGLGYDSVLSEYSDVLYDPREHAHKSCLAEVATCDIVVLVIGSRFGSSLSPDVLATSMQDLHPLNFDGATGGARVSVTQAEALSAAAKGIPLFAFVESGVYHDYTVYQRNKGKPFAAEITYPSIAQAETAEYIFNFIDYLQGRSFNNAVITFDRIEDMVSHLQKQWAGLFQRLLAEVRVGRDDSQRIDRLADQFQDLKAALLATVADAPGRRIAKAVIRSRRLVDFLRALPNSGTPLREAFIAGDCSFSELLEQIAGVISIEEDVRETPNYVRTATLLRTDDGREYTCRYSLSALQRIESEWQEVRSLQPQDRTDIYEALLDTEERMGIGLIRPVVNSGSGEPTGLPKESLRAEGLPDSALSKAPEDEDPAPSASHLSTS